uniref:DnaJ subfamily B member 8 n=1 Tax=Anthurium amnicola TaxID=1678845 RepID=A0A1D1YBP8_9ARAE
MNRALRTPFMGHQPASALSSGTAASLFHSTPVLDRRRRTQWDTASSPFGHSSKRLNNYTKRFRRMEAKQALLRNVSMYAEYLFQSWKYDDDRGASNDSSWYKKQYWAKAAKRNGFDSQDSQWDTYRNRRKGRYEFCFSDDEEVETIFQTASGGKRGFYWSFSSEEKFHWGGLFGYENQSGSSNWRYKSEYVEDDTSTVKDVTPERLALGLSTSGPLNREEVKKAYRACALRWHPDRHEGSSKVEAEEKFKLCSAAYESLCQKLAID